MALEPGESADVAFKLDARAFSHWGESGWTVAAGVYGIRIGSSSRDLRLRGTFVVP